MNLVLKLHILSLNSHLLSVFPLTVKLIEYTFKNLV